MAVACASASAGAGTRHLTLHYLPESRVPTIFISSHGSSGAPTRLALVPQPSPLPATTPDAFPSALSWLRQCLREATYYWSSLPPSRLPSSTTSHASANILQLRVAALDLGDHRVSASQVWHPGRRVREPRTVIGKPGVNCKAQRCCRRRWTMLSDSSSMSSTPPYAFRYGRLFHSVVKSFTRLILR